MRTKMNNNAFSLVEVLMAVTFTVLLMTGVYGFYNTSSRVFSSGVTGDTLQNVANVILQKIIEGESESGVVYRLATSDSYAIADGISHILPLPFLSYDTRYSCGGAPQTTPCNTMSTSGPISELYFCQDNPGNDPCGITNADTPRWYYLNSTGTAIKYHHPAAGGGTQEETIYTAPPGATIKLRFSPAAVATNQVHVVEIDVSLTQGTSSGSASTFVLLRNHS